MTEQIDVHNDIQKKLQYLHSVSKIPNIIFHGAYGAGKRTIMYNFINLIYDNNKEKIKSYVMYVNCAYGKGIRFIREELKFFAKTHIQSNGGNTFKSVVLLNADKLTTDAQSALRRCIELHNHTTRFFIVVEDKYKILKPILSRFCEIYVYNPRINDKSVNLYQYNLGQCFHLKTYTSTRMDWIKKELSKPLAAPADAIGLANKLYDKGYSSLDLVELLEKNNSVFNDLDELVVYELLIGFHKVKREMKNEKMLMYFMIHFIYFEHTISLNNLSFI